MSCWLCTCRSRRGFQKPFGAFAMNTISYEQHCRVGTLWCQANINNKTFSVYSVGIDLQNRPSCHKIPNKWNFHLQIGTAKWKTFSQNFCTNHNFLKARNVKKYIGGYTSFLIISSFFTMLLLHLTSLIYKIALINKHIRQTRKPMSGLAVNKAAAFWPKPRQPRHSLNKEETLTLLRASSKRWNYLKNSFCCW